MAGLLLKNIPPELHAELKRRAARNRRSLTQEAIAILETSLQEETRRPTLEEIKRWQVHGAKPLTDALLRRARRQGRP